MTAPPEGGRLALNTTPEYLLNAVIVSPWESVENPAPNPSQTGVCRRLLSRWRAQRPDGVEATWAVC